jgi:hypothetical protein
MPTAPPPAADKPAGPNPIEIYTVAEEFIEEAVAYLRDAGAQHFIHEYSNYYEVVVTYNGTRSSPAAAAVHKAMGDFSVIQLVLLIHTNFSCYEVMARAGEIGVRVMTFNAQDKSGYLVTVRGTPLRLEKFWAHFSSHVT